MLKSRPKGMVGRTNVGCTHCPPAGQRSFAMLTLDVTSDESVGAAVREVMRLEGHIDLLVNNAGVGVALAGVVDAGIRNELRLD